MSPPVPVDIELCPAPPLLKVPVEVSDPPLPQPRPAVVAAAAAAMKKVVRRDERRKWSGKAMMNPRKVGDDRPPAQGAGPVGTWGAVGAPQPQLVGAGPGSGDAGAGRPIAVGSGAAAEGGAAPPHPPRRSATATIERIVVHEITPRGLPSRAPADLSLGPSTNPARPTRLTRKSERRAARPCARRDFAENSAARRFGIHLAERVGITTSTEILDARQLGFASTRLRRSGDGARGWLDEPDKDNARRRRGGSPASACLCASLTRAGRSRFRARDCRLRLLRCS